MTKSLKAAIPYAPAAYEPVVMAGLKALQAGNASAHQQQRVLKWLIEEASGCYEFHYYPSERDTAFALGRAFPGQQVVKLLNTNLRRSDVSEVPATL